MGTARRRRRIMRKGVLTLPARERGAKMIPPLPVRRKELIQKQKQCWRLRLPPPAWSWTRTGTSSSCSCCTSVVLRKTRHKVLEIEVIRTFFAKSERKKPFTNAEIDACIDKMADENKVMRSDDTVFII